MQDDPPLKGDADLGGLLFYF